MVSTKNASLSATNTTTPLDCPKNWSSGVPSIFSLIYNLTSRKQLCQEVAWELQRHWYQPKGTGILPEFHQLLLKNWYYSALKFYSLTLMSHIIPEDMWYLYADILWGKFFIPLFNQDGSAQLDIAPYSWKRWVLKDSLTLRSFIRAFPSGLFILVDKIFGWNLF